MATEYGFVYVLSNEAMPGIFKIGFTANHPKTRIDQLSGATACPTYFELAAAIGVENPRVVEQEIHAMLQNHRFNSSREFFRASPSVISACLDEFSDYECDFVFSTKLDELCHEELLEQKDRLRQEKIDYFLEQSADPIQWSNFSSQFDDLPF